MRSPLPVVVVILCAASPSAAQVVASIQWKPGFTVMASVSLADPDPAREVSDLIAYNAQTGEADIAIVDSPTYRVKDARSGSLGHCTGTVWLPAGGDSLTVLGSRHVEGSFEANDRDVSLLLYSTSTGVAHLVSVRRPEHCQIGAFEQP